MVSAMMAPELKNLEKSVLAKELGLPEKKITKSSLRVQMNLIGRNRNSIVNCFDEIVDGIGCREDINKLEKAINRRKDALKEPSLVGT